eukprot:Lithocolla_globosa_v1_NODE_235_length_4952_cov_23.562883.p2 type:complete len:132 gc:universal NODE_235_length_4952_cov_23.562883:3108-2713(-)
MPVVASLTLPLDLLVKVILSTLAETDPRPPVCLVTSSIPNVTILSGSRTRPAQSSRATKLASSSKSPMVLRAGIDLDFLFVEIEELEPGGIYSSSLSSPSSSPSYPVSSKLRSFDEFRYLFFFFQLHFQLC